MLGQRGFLSRGADWNVVTRHTTEAAPRKHLRVAFCLTRPISEKMCSNSWEFPISYKGRLASLVAQLWKRYDCCAISTTL